MNQNVYNCGNERSNHKYLVINLKRILLVIASHSTLSMTWYGYVMCRKLSGTIRVVWCMCAAVDEITASKSNSRRTFFILLNLVGIFVSSYDRTLVKMKLTVCYCPTISWLTDRFHRALSSRPIALRHFWHMLGYLSVSIIFRTLTRTTGSSMWSFYVCIHTWDLSSYSHSIKGLSWLFWSLYCHQ